MVRYSKIPARLKGTDVIAISHMAIFCSSLIKAGDVMTKLVNREKKPDMPICGYVKLGKEKIYWCRYGFLNSDIYVGAIPVKVSELQPGQRFKFAITRKRKVYTLKNNLLCEDDGKWQGGFPERLRGKCMLIVDGCRQLIVNKDQEVILQ